VQVAALVYEGLTNREIGVSIGTTEQVIKNYLRVVFDKLGVWSRLELALYIANHGAEHWRERMLAEAAPADKVPSEEHAELRVG
jgi:DNA-binding CsgD family transcriptional regulator